MALDGIVRRIARELSDSDITIGLKSNLVWQEMDEPEQRRFEQVVEFVLLRRTELTGS